MSNTHTVPDFASELQASFEDMLPACVISTTWPTLPVPPSMTLAAFTTQAYVRDLQQLVYVDQPAITLTLSGSDGTYWISVARDVSTAHSGWTRRPGSHYLFRLSGSRPADTDGLLVFASATVSGSAVTAVSPAPGVTLAEAWRARAGLGTMATQDASAVAITGGSAGFTALVTAQAGLSLPNYGANDVAALSSTMQHAGGTNRYVINHTGNAQARFGGRVGIQQTPEAFAGLSIAHLRASGAYACYIKPDQDTGNPAVAFANAAAILVGSISANATVTSFNTSSDARLKEGIATLVGALAVVRALRPVSFRWQADGSRGNGFLAHELMKTIPEAVSGEPDAVNDDGSIKPQQVDHSKLVPWLTAALQETLTQVQALTARVTSLEEQLGI